MNDVTIPSDPMKEFRERVAAKLREDIGAMLPDDALTAMVQQAVEDQFFKPRVVDDGSYHKKIVPSWFVQEVAKAAEPQIKDLVTAYVQDNREVIKQAIDEFLDKERLALMTFVALRDATHADVANLAEQVITRMRQNY